MVSDVLTRGIWCKNCQWVEDDELGKQACLSCGCENDDHIKVKVIKDDDDELLHEWELDLPIKVHQAMKRAGIVTMGQLREALDAKDPHFMDIRGIGLKSYEQTKDQLRRWDEANG